MVLPQLLQLFLGLLLALFWVGQVSNDILGLLGGVDRQRVLLRIIALQILQFSELIVLQEYHRQRHGEVGRRNGSGVRSIAQVEVRVVINRDTRHRLRALLSLLAGRRPIVVVGRLGAEEASVGVELRNVLVGVLPCHCGASDFARILGAFALILLQSLIGVHVNDLLSHRTLPKQLVREVAGWVVEVLGVE